MQNVCFSITIINISLLFVILYNTLSLCHPFLSWTLETVLEHFVPTLCVNQVSYCQIKSKNKCFQSVKSETSLHSLHLVHVCSQVKIKISLLTLLINFITGFVCSLNLSLVSGFIWYKTTQTHVAVTLIVHISNVNVDAERHDGNASDRFTAGCESMPGCRGCRNA